MALRTPEKPDEYTPAQNPGEIAEQELLDNEYYKRHGEAAGNPTDPRGDVAAGDSSDQRSTAGDLSDREQDAGFSKKEGDLEDRESSGDGGWSNNTTPGALRHKGSIARIAGSKAKFGLILGVMSSGTVLSILAIFIMGSLGLINFKETILAYVSQRTVDTMISRQAKIMDLKFSNSLDRGCVVEKLCRYRGMYDRQVDRFNRRNASLGIGVEATGEKDALGRNKVQVYRFDPNNYDPSGNFHKTPISSAEYNRLRFTDPKIRQANSNFFKPFVEAFSGRAAQSVWAKTKVFLGKRTLDKGVGDTEEERLKSQERQMTRKAVSGAEVDLARGVSGRSGSSGDVATDAEADSLSKEMGGDVEDAVSSRVDEINADSKDYSKSIADPPLGSEANTNMYKSVVDKIRSKGGGLAGLANPLAAFQAICTVKAIVVAANQARHIEQAVQLMRFAIMFGSVADRIKSGEADGNTSAQIGVLMAMLTSLDSSRKSASDSAGYGWVTHGVVRQGKDEDLSLYQNGGRAPGVFGSVAQEASDKVPSSICGVAESKTVTGISIAVSIIPGVGEIAAAPLTFLKVGLKEGISKIIKEYVENTTLKGFIKETAARAGGMAVEGAGLYVFYSLAIPPLISVLAHIITNSVVSGDEEGRDVGNAMVSGYAASNSQIAKTQGLEPLSVDEAVSQDRTAYNNQERIAKEEGINQLDVNNRFSFANKLATTLAPISANMASSVLNFSPFEAIGNLSSMVGLSSSLLIDKANAATDPSDQYKFCDDKEYKDAKVAVDMFCNPQYGAGAKDEPEDVLRKLDNMGVIDDQGGPTGDFQDYIDSCITSTSPVFDDERCTSKDEKYQLMRLYCMDTSIDVDMNDGEGVSCIPKVDSGSSSTATTTESGGEVVTGEAKELAQKILDDGNITLQDNPKSSIEAAATGKESPAGVDKCGTQHPPVSLDKGLLSMLATMSKKGFKFTITSLTTGTHGCDSDHYKGKGVDIGTVNGVQSTGRSSEDVKFIEEIVKSDLMPKGSGFGQTGCGPEPDPSTPGYAQFDDSCNHLHISYRDGG